MSPGRLWIRLISPLVPGDRRAGWIEEWDAELWTRGGSMTYAWGALADAWYLRTEGWTMDAMWRDVKGAVRGLVRKPFFTALAGLTLAVGIGANTAIFSVVDAVLLDPLDFPEPDRLVSYNHDAPRLGVKVPVVPHSEAMYMHYAANARALSAFAVFSGDNVNLVTDGEPRQLSASQVTQGYFDVLGVGPLAGRTFVEGEDREGAEPVAVLSEALWEDAFGRDPDVVGRLVEMDGVMRRVVGVVSGGLGMSEEDLWIPMTIDEAEPDAGSLGLIGIGRLAPGATVEQANAEMLDLLQRFAEAYPDELSSAMMEQTGLTADVKPLKEVFVADVRQALWVVLATVGFVLLIACANVANLFLVRAEGRQREQALRTALGASAADIVRQYLAESLALAVGAGALGLVLGLLGLQGLLSMAPSGLPDLFDLGLDGSVLAFTALISLGSGILFGLFPAFGYGRRDLSGGLKEGGRSSTSGRERHRLRSGLVVSQVALAMVLLVGSGLMVRSFVALRDVDLGFVPEDVLTFRFALPGAEYEDAGQTLTFERRLSERLAAIPGVRGVGMMSGLPLTDSKSASPTEPLDRPFPEGELAPIIERRNVTPGVFEALGVPILEGRGPSWDDGSDGLQGVVVSASLAAQFWPGESAVGRRLRSQGSEQSWEVVGVVGDVRHDAVEDDPMPVVYLPVVVGTPESPSGVRSLAVALKVTRPLDAVPAAREALAEIDPRLPMIGPRTMQSIVTDSMTSTSFTVLMLGVAAGIALLLGTVGIYGVISYVVSRRTQEIGVRMALGAPASQVLRSVLRQGLALTGLGIALGLLGAWAMSVALTSLLYGVDARDPATFVGTTLVIAAVALLASWLPARRASRVDPVEALRTE